MSRQQKLANVFLVFAASLENQKRFIRIPALNVPEMRSLGTFLVNFLKRLPWKR